MRIESTHHVQQREQDERELAELSTTELSAERELVEAAIEQSPDWAFGSNGHDRRLRRLRAIDNEIEKRSL